MKIGEKVRSLQFGTVGFLHHINDRKKAWVSDHPDGSNGQYFLLDDLVPFKELEKSGHHSEPDVR